MFELTHAVYASDISWFFFFWGGVVELIILSKFRSEHWQMSFIYLFVFLIIFMTSFDCFVTPTVQIWAFAGFLLNKSAFSIAVWKTDLKSIIRGQRLFVCLSKSQYTSSVLSWTMFGMKLFNRHLKVFKYDNCYFFPLFFQNINPHALIYKKHFTCFRQHAVNKTHFFLTGKIQWWSINTNSNM